MVSTYLGYTMVTRDMATSLNQVASQSQNKRLIDYYNANIGKVTNVDDFMDDYQLYSYAMEAYGLSDMTYAKALMKQVLTSD
ncbi:MAG TPA: flagellar protein, partial [Rhizobium sp.]